jgi:DNA-binding IclR family transcriptional regulator
MDENVSGGTVKTTETAFAILELLHEQDGGTVSSVADQLDMAKSTIHRHLTTLNRLEYVVREGNQYHPGLKFAELGQYVRSRRLAYELAADQVNELAEETEERADFIVEEHGRCVYVHSETGQRAVQTDAGVGKTLPMHSTAAGKIILANMPEEDVKRILTTKGLPGLTENTMTEVEDLLQELETIRERGYAFNNQENIDGLRAVAVPVMGRGNEVIGALAISGPTHRLKGDWFEREIPDLLLGSANELELNIEYS